METIFKNKTTKIEIDEENILIYHKDSGLKIKTEELILLLSKLIIEHPILK